MIVQAVAYQKNAEYFADSKSSHYQKSVRWGGIMLVTLLFYE